MRYNAFINNGKLNLTHDDTVILTDISLFAEFSRNNCPAQVEYVPEKIARNENEITVNFTRAVTRSWLPEASDVSLTFREEENAICAFASVTALVDSGPFNFTLAPQHTLRMSFDFPQNHGNLTTVSCDNPFMPKLHIVESLSDTHVLTQSISVKIANEHVNLISLSSPEAISVITPDGIELNTYSPLKEKLTSTLFILAASSCPFDAIHTNFTSNRPYYIAKPVSERPFPKELEGFGWCTYDAFYWDVNEEGIFKKLDEFREKGIKLKWLLIDDGWSQYKDNRLMSFKEDFTKFPNGLKHCVEKAKREYGVEYVGAWHAVSGYWDGISKNGEIYETMKDCLYQPYDFWTLPGETYEKAFKFWDTWHSYLAAQGIDFVKIDNQGNIKAKFDYISSNIEGIRTQFSALEASVKKNFNGAIINCMGSDLDLNFNRPETCINRNSTDFAPKSKHSIINHITQNIYCAAVNGELNCCDFDMFWSKHENATLSAVLRAISGGPVYVSDEVGNTDADALKPLVALDGSVYRFPHAALPTLDCFYRDCPADGIAQKAFNTCGGNIVMAAFGLTVDKTVSGQFRLSDIPDADDEYLAHDFFENKYFVFNRDTVIDFTLDYNTCKLISLYPISDGKAYIGDPAYYAEAAMPDPHFVTVDEITK